jgi:hypothetical protein
MVRLTGGVDFGFFFILFQYTELVFKPEKIASDFGKFWKNAWR